MAEPHEVRAVLALCEAALAPTVESYDALDVFQEVATPAVVAALCRRVIDLERGLFEWHRVVDVGGETPRCRGCGASPIFTGADPRSMPVHAADCWVAALLAAGGHAESPA